MLLNLATAGRKMMEDMIVKPKKTDVIRQGFPSDRFRAGMVEKARQRYRGLGVIPRETPRLQRRPIVPERVLAAKEAAQQARSKREARMQRLYQMFPEGGED